ncbi:hypothetical protein [Rhizobium gallicum]|uniref:hypothetical protein n=1 Tax=Rhizobium gallicum TaxID=56730 RepID=UPI001EF80D25|nr:hypothetical protein [Rhizobium gallicum]ULJ74169.1 hypothetical protein L2W42_15570 [Rhizobium gallicum]
MAGFIRSPEAVLECSAYHEAPPHPAAANPSAGSMKELAAIATAVIIERLIFFKTDYPSTIELAPLGAAGLKSGEKWRKSAADYHGMLQCVIFVSLAEFELKKCNCRESGKKIRKSGKIRTIFSAAAH